jgi:hypothetical protein
MEDTDLENANTRRGEGGVFLFRLADLVNDPGDPPVLSIGSVSGGTTEISAGWTAPIRWLANAVGDLLVGVDSPLRVNVVLQIPGRFIGVDFQGARTSKFSKKSMHLMIQVALPEAPPENPQQYLQARMIEAIDLAESWAIHRGYVRDLNPLRSIIEQLL